MRRRFIVAFGSLLILGCVPHSLAQQGSVGDNSGYRLAIPDKIDARFDKDAQPQLHIHFSVEKNDKSGFTRLRTQDQVSANLIKKDSSVPVGHELTQTNSQTAGVPVLFMLDVSGSMLHPANVKDETFNKLTVVKDTMREFVDSGKLSQIEIATFFDLGMERTILEKGEVTTAAERAAAEAAISEIEASHEDRPTALYEAMKWALQEGQRQGIHQIVFLTDGKDETYGGYSNFERLKKVATASEEQAYRNWQIEQETDIINLAFQNGRTRIHTIGIGNPSAGLFEDSFTDCTTLGRISDKTAGQNNCVDTLALQALKEPGSQTEYTGQLRGKLKSILDQLNETFHYDYELQLSMNRNDLQIGPNDIRVELQVEQQTLYMDVHFNWDGYSITDPSQENGLIPLPPPRVDVDLNPIAIRIGGILGALALIPAAYGWIQSLFRRKQQKSALIVLDDNSQYVGKECPEERRRLGTEYLFKAGDPIVVCPQCRTAHHLDCWINGGNRCYLQNCRAIVPISEKDLDRLGFQTSVGQ